LILSLAIVAAYRDNVKKQKFANISTQNQMYFEELEKITNAQKCLL
jgi:hypothetical protein